MTACMILKSTLLLLLCMVIILTTTLVQSVVEKDYYKILGIGRTANQQQIKKAYKKLSIKWHPDKNKDNPDKAKEMFIDVSNAFDTLNDPVKRNIYDREGIKGVQDHEQRSGQQNLKRDIFGRVIHEQDPSEVREDLFSGTDVFQLNLNTIHSFYRRNQVWVILFYKSNQQESKNVKGQFIELVNRMYGIFGTAAVDCLAEEEICEEFVVFDTPSVVVFTEDSDEGHKYTDAFEWNKISKFATKKMQSFISIVNNENYHSFINRDPLNYKALVFGNKKSPSALMKSLSKIYKGKILFGYVRNSEQELLSKFNVTQLPTLLVVTDPISDLYEIYQGESKLESLKDFFRPFAYYKKDQPQRSQDIIELTERMHQMGVCSSSSKSLWFILLTKEGENITPTVDNINSIVDLYTKDPISFYYVHINKNPSFKSNFENISAIIYRPSAKKFAEYDKPDFSPDNVRAFVDNIISGNGRFKKLESDIVFGDVKQEDL